MTRLSTLGRSVVFAGLFAPSFLHAQDDSTWLNNFLQGSEAIRVGRYPDARRFLLAALEQSRRFDANDVRRAQTDAVLATVYQLQGELDLAAPLYLEARSILEANGGAGKSSLPFVVDSIGELLFEQGRWAEAEQLLNEARALHVEIHGESDPATMVAARHLGELYAAVGRYPEAETLLEQATKVFRASGHTGALASALVSLGHLYLIQGRYSLAEPALKEAVQLNTALGDRHPAFADSLVNLAVLYRVEHQNDRAEPLLRKAMKIYRDAGDPHLAGVLTEMGENAMTTGKYATAEKHLQEALDLTVKTFGPEHVTVALTQLNLSEACLAERDYSRAGSLVHHALPKLLDSLGESNAQVAKAHLIAAQVEERQNQASQADADYREAIALYKRTMGGAHPQALQAQELYSRFVKKLRK